MKLGGFAIILALLGVVLLIVAIRGNYAGVWAALTGPITGPAAGSKQQPAQGG